MLEVAPQPLFVNFSPTFGARAHAQGRCGARRVHEPAASRTADAQRNPGAEWLEKSTAEQMGAFKEINILSGYRITRGYFK